MPGSTSPASRILDGLKSKSPEQREEAQRALISLPAGALSPAEGRALLAAAADFTPDEDGYSPASDLVLAALASPHPSYAAVIRQHFAGYDRPARSAATLLLTALATAESLKALLDLLALHAADLPEIRLEPLVSSTPQAKVLFPGLLAYATYPQLALDIFALALTYLESGAITPADLGSIEGAVIASFHGIATTLIESQQPGSSAWTWADAYQPYRAAAMVLLDMMGYLDGEESERLLRLASGFSDPRLAFAGFMGLMNRELSVPDELFERMAANPETRNWLYEELEGLGRLDRFPTAFLTQAALAEGDMVSWLIDPQALGRAPDALDLREIVTVQLTGDYADFFVFRFRVEPPHPAASMGWMAGVAGPYSRAAGLVTRAPGTSSRYEPFDAASPDDHAARAIDMLARWHEDYRRNQDKSPKK